MSDLESKVAAAAILLLGLLLGLLLAWQRHELWRAQTDLLECVADVEEANWVANRALKAARAAEGVAP